MHQVPKSEFPCLSLMPRLPNVPVLTCSGYKLLAGLNIHVIQAVIANNMLTSKDKLEWGSLQTTTESWYNLSRPLNPMFNDTEKFGNLKSHCIDSGNVPGLPFVRCGTVQTCLRWSWAFWSVRRSLWTWWQWRSWSGRRGSAADRSAAPRQRHESGGHGWLRPTTADL